MVRSDPTERGRIFMSYRRDDTSWPCALLYEHLAARYGPMQVFKDIDNIEPGGDFVREIADAVGSCDVLLALIGQRWLTIEDEDGRRRLDAPDDFVRLEIESALDRGVKVIPILVHGAAMPRRDELPGSIADLSSRQAVELNPQRFGFESGRLFKAVDRTLEDVRAAPNTPVRPHPEAVVALSDEQREPAPPDGDRDPDEPAPRRSRRARLTLGGLLAVVVLTVGAMLVPSPPPGRDPSPDPPRPSTDDGAQMDFAIAEPGGLVVERSWVLTDSTFKARLCLQAEETYTDQFDEPVPPGLDVRFEDLDVEPAPATHSDGPSLTLRFPVELGAGDTTEIRYSADVDDQQDSSRTALASLQGGWERAWQEAREFSSPLDYRTRPFAHAIDGTRSEQPCTD